MRSSSVQVSKPYSPVKKAAKNVVKTALVTTAAAGTIAYLGYKGKLNPVEGGNKILEGAKALLKKPADFLVNKGTGIVNTVNIASKGNPALSSVIDKASGAFKTVKGFVGNAIDAVKNFAEKNINPEKVGKAAENATTQFNA